MADDTTIFVWSVPELLYIRNASTITWRLDASNIKGQAFLTEIITLDEAAFTLLVPDPALGVKLSTLINYVEEYLGSDGVNLVKDKLNQVIDYNFSQNIPKSIYINRLEV
jgi:hypothetical protein